MMTSEKTLVGPEEMYIVTVHFAVNIPSAFGL